MLTKDQVLEKVSFPILESHSIFVRGVIDTGGIPKVSEIPIPGKKAIYREDTGKILALPSKTYNITPHAQLVEGVFEAFDKQDIEYTPVKVELPNNGAKLFVHLRTPEVFTIGDKGDEVQMETIITNSYDGSLPRELELGGNRLICTNGMRAYRKDFSVTKKHYTFNTADMIQEFMDQVRRFKEIFLPFLRQCAELEITGQEAVELISALEIGKKYQKAAINQWSEERAKLGANHWALYNALTYVATHVTKSYMVQRGLEIQAFQAISKRVERR